MKTKSLSTGGISTPQVVGSLHLKAYRNLYLTKALLSPIITSKVLAWLYELALAPTVHTIVVAVIAPLTHVTPSIVIAGVAALRFVPVRVISYPPAMLPYLGETDVTMGVLSCLNYIALVNV